MADHQFNDDWVDRYIRDELSADDEAVFEEALLEDPELQAQVESALGIREALKKDQVFDSRSSVTELPTRNQWTTLAMAASVLLAVVSTTFFWRASVETNELRQQIADLRQPRTSVLQVPVNIMRSTGNTTPDVIIQKPAGQGVIVLDIELSAAFQNLPGIQFELGRKDASPVISWAAAPGKDGRASAVLNSEIIPDGLIYLTMTSSAGDLSESRLLEFRPAR